MSDHKWVAEDVLSSIQRVRCIVVLRLQDHSQTVKIGRILAAEGVGVMEVTLDNPDSLSAIRQLRDALGEEVTLGAGTVRTTEQVREAAESGAQFCVSPHVDPRIVSASKNAGLVSIPGACTPTEVEMAIDAGADCVKLFPAGPLGVKYLAALRSPFPNVRFVPTGGISHGELRPWYEAGAFAVGLGSDLVRVKDLSELRRRAKIAAGQRLTEELP